MANKERAAVQSGLNDILGSVIQSDQRSAGRAQKEPPQTTDSDTVPGNIDPTPMDTHQDAGIMTIRQYDNTTSVQEDKQTNNAFGKHGNPSKPPERRMGPTAVAPYSLVETRLEEVAKMAQAATMTVTLRIPAPLNEWLDEYVHRSWPKKVKKQELVIEALQLLFVRRGRPGEEILETDFLADRKM